MKISRFAILVAAIFLLAGCMVSLVSMDSRLTLLADEKWDMQIDVVLPGDVAQAYGADLVSQIDESVQGMEAQGVMVDYELSNADQEGNITLKVRFRGQGYELFNEVLGTSGSITTEVQGNKKIIHVYIVDIASGLQLINGSTYTIKGGKILSTNGNRVNANSVEWDNATSIEVTMEEPGAGISGLGIALVILGILFIAFAIGWQLGWFRKHRPRQVVIEPMATHDDTTSSTWNEAGTGESSMPENSPEFNFCPNCGTQLASQARFCTACGYKIKA